MYPTYWTGAIYTLHALDNQEPHLSIVTTPCRSPVHVRFGYGVGDIEVTLALKRAQPFYPDTAANLQSLGMS
jgi:hypothetical protein